MATFITLVNWTNEGIKEVKKSPDRLDAVKKAFKAAGAELKAFYLVMGRYDMVIIAEAPDAETASKIALTVASAGAVRTETLHAFTEAEYRKIVAGLP
jgi:uncharacterized protein with GYD domain